MLTPNEDETKPTKIEPASNLEETTPTHIEPSSPLEETVPTNAIMEPAAEDTGPVRVESASAGEDTGPISVEIGPKSKKKEKGPRGPKRWPWVLLGIFMILLLGAAGAYLGYQNGIGVRLAKANQQVTFKAAEHFNLGKMAEQSGQLENARIHYAYVIQLDPNFPGAAEALAQVMFKMAITATPTVAPTMTLTPTPDLRGVEELYSQAQAKLSNKEWDAAIDTIEALRKADINYKAVEVDGLYYMALRNRGVDKILKDGNLEGGMYDLSLAERFGPLDKDADGYRTWARLYVTGASFWGIDWSQVVNYFSQIVPALPNLRDGSGRTAAERYRIALIKYGDAFASQEDYCSASDQYHLALSINSNDPVAPTATRAYEKCHPPTEKPKHTKTPKDIPEEETPVPPTDEPPADSTVEPF